MEENGTKHWIEIEDDPEGGYYEYDGDYEVYSGTITISYHWVLDE